MKVAQKVMSKNPISGEIREFDSVAIAARHFKCNKGNIPVAIFKNGTCKGHLFSYDGIFVQSDFSKLYNKPVTAIYPDATEVCFQSCAEASRALSLDKSQVRKVAQGKLTRCKQYKFKYTKIVTP